MKAHRLVEQTVTVAVDSWKCDRCGKETDSVEDDPLREGFPVDWWEQIRRNSLTGLIERKHVCDTCEARP